jgi:hypothetical protein
MIDSEITPCIARAILVLDPTAEVSVIDEDYDKITWHDGNPTNITKEQIIAKKAELQAVCDSLKYRRLRELEYPSIEELTVALWESVVEERMDAVTDLEIKRLAVKAKYPKDPNG